LLLLSRDWAWLGFNGDKPMCNLYNLTIGPQAILEFTRAVVNEVGNLEPGKIYPDYSAPIVRNGEDNKRELVRARWGMPTPPKFLEGKKVDKGVTNVRNASSPHWRRWLGVESRCVVPVTEFAEPCVFRTIRPVIPATSGHLNRGIRPPLCSGCEA